MSPNIPSEVWIVGRTRNELMLGDTDRLPTIIAMALNGQDAFEELLRLSHLSPAEIEKRQLHYPQIDPLELCYRLEKITGDPYEACLYELSQRPGNEGS